MFKKMLLLMAAALFSVNGLVFAQSSMTIVDLPATGTDAAIGIDTTKTYTHAFDFGESGIALVNGVEFEDCFLFGKLTEPVEGVSTQGYGYVIDDTRMQLDPPFFEIKAHGGNDVDTYCDGESAEIFRDMIYFSLAQNYAGEGILVILKDLVPGTEYSVRFYSRPWDPPLPRPCTLFGDGASNGVFADSIRIDIDNDRPGACYIDYTFVADDNNVTLKYISHDLAQGPHIYGLTCEIVSQVGVDSRSGTKASMFELMQNYPNPFNPNTNIQFQIPKDGHVTISVYNSLGQQVATLVDGNLKSGMHHVTFDAAKFSSGIYFYRIKAGDFLKVNKMLLLK